MTRGYHHLTRDQRCQFNALKDSGESMARIAQKLEVHRSTVYRELVRNQGPNGYIFQQAQQIAYERKNTITNNRLKMTSKLVALIEDKLKLQWSPEQISGWLKKNQSHTSVSHETIYKYIWKNKREGGSLYKELRHHGKRYNKRGSGKAGRGCIPERMDISERPLIVEEKSRIGDWEIDTIIGKEHKGAIISIVDRCSKLTLLARVTRKTAEEVEEALTTRLGCIAESVLTLTADNGKEFSNHRGIAKKLGTKVYFARPYHSWERGLNEHTNGLIRQYLPKNERLDTVADVTVREIETLLNNRPRKVLQFRTPIEVFNEQRTRSNLVALQN